MALNDHEAPIIRPATAEDRPALVELTKALQAFEMPLEPNRCPPEEMAEPHLDRMSDWAERSGGGVFVACDASTGAVLALAICGVADSDLFTRVEYRKIGQISDLVVAENSRGRGAGKLLIRACEERLAAAGVLRIEIGVLCANRAAQAAYAACGYHPADMTVARYLGGPLCND